MYGSSQINMRNYRSCDINCWVISNVTYLSADIIDLSQINYVNRINVCGAHEIDVGVKLTIQKIMT